MEYVTVYTINEEHVEVPMIKPYIELDTSFAQGRKHIVDHGESVYSYRDQYNIIKLPVEEIINNEIIKDSYGRSIDVLTDRSFIAVQPELKEMFSLEWKQKYEETVLDLNKVVGKWDSFWKLPWYKRILKSLRG